MLCWLTFCAKKLTRVNNGDYSVPRRGPPPSPIGVEHEFELSALSRVLFFVHDVFDHGFE